MWNRRTEVGNRSEGWREVVERRRKREARGKKMKKRKRRRRVKWPRGSAVPLIVVICGQRGGKK
jgi:hypothetical protein